MNTTGFCGVCNAEFPLDDWDFHRHPHREPSRREVWAAIALCVAPLGLVPWVPGPPLLRLVLLGALYLTVVVPVVNRLVPP